MKEFILDAAHQEVRPGDFIHVLGKYIDRIMVIGFSSKGNPQMENAQGERVKFYSGQKFIKTFKQEF